MDFHGNLYKALIRSISVLSFKTASPKTKNPTQVATLMDKMCVLFLGR